MTSVDFTAWFHPVAAVECPTCQARRGARCRRPSGHSAAQFHAARGEAADALFIETHGEQAWIERLPGDGWKVHLSGYAGDPVGAEGVRSADASPRGARRGADAAQLSMGF